MITYYVKQSKVYTITSPEECVIYDKNDNKVGTCGAGASVDVTATTSQLKLSVDSAVLTHRVKESEVTDTINKHVADTSAHLTPVEKSRIEYGDGRYAQRKEVNYFDKTNTFRSPTYLEGGVCVLPLGTKTALGADAYGLSVSADGGLQLWGTHFLQGSIWGENGLKMVQNEVSLTSTESVAIGFDYANDVVFRTMPNDGDGHGVYQFQCWKWEDDSHTNKVLGACDVRKKAAMTPTDESLLNRSENDSRYGRLADANEWLGVQTIYAPDGNHGANKIIQIRDASGQYPGYNICFRNEGSLEIFDEDQNPTTQEPYFQIYRPFGQRTYACHNFCVKGTTELRKAVRLTNTSSLTASCPATFQGAVTFNANAEFYGGVTFGNGLTANSITIERDDLTYVPNGSDVLTRDECDARYLPLSSVDQTVETYFTFKYGFDTTQVNLGNVNLHAGTLYDDDGASALIVDGAIRTHCIIRCCHLETSGNIWTLVGGIGEVGGNFRFDTSKSQFVMSAKLSVPDLVINGKTIDEIVEAKVNAILTEKGLI